jgi:hypothetical protein
MLELSRRQAIARVCRRRASAVWLGSGTSEPSTRVEVLLAAFFTVSSKTEKVGSK